MKFNHDEYEKIKRATKRLEEHTFLPFDEAYPDDPYLDGYPWDHIRAVVPALQEWLRTNEDRYLWDEYYPQEELCTCGHPYYRHFDSYENNRAVGCKYCPCQRHRTDGLDDYICPTKFHLSKGPNVDWHHEPLEIEGGWYCALCGRVFEHEQNGDYDEYTF